MKLSNDNLQNLATAIIMAGRDKDQPRTLPWKVAYALARTTAAIKPLLEAYEAARKAIMEKHAPGKQMVQQTDPVFPEIIKEMEELNRCEVEFTGHRFKVADIEGTPMAPVTLTALLPLIEE